MLLALAYPSIDPVLVRIGPVEIRWYALAYVGGLAFAWWFMRRLAGTRPAGSRAGSRILDDRAVDDLMFWATLGVIVGGRLGYVIFYKPGFYLENPERILALWQGGMAFHGGLIGVALAIVLFCRKRRIDMFSAGDLAACAVPLGLLLGRLANFVNGELWGRVSDVPWAMVFPGGGPLPRHPSQLYEAVLEGLLLFAVINLWRRRTGALDRPGELTGLFCAGYGIARFIVEFFRQPDAFLPGSGFLFGFVTMGQLLSLPLVALGVWLILRARKRAAVAVNPAADKG
ncbi:MAG: prolipoprotein diacylglyceryl transferase [Rhodospirillaceae bacterium]|nr:prolipoprotein diacylglyceryl transferase [Rhodospirillaceae bacterium]MYH37957.1 prolipoprotein diacylglyceryl transferase [Rhodospirillaceae bacterium]MYK15122.1 prolipoprotein diacylglyceryl transferase [Rhodospirillaceae bacterium]